MDVRSRLFYHWPTLLIFGIGGLVGIALLLGFGPERLSVHISCFAFRDVNRNGVYDIEDRPYAGLKVTMTRPSGGPVQQVSNLSGFTNFDLSRSRRIGDLRSPGEHTIHVEVPKNWRVTSRNDVQTIVISKREASITGLVANRTFDAVGVAPDLAISGTVAVDEHDPGTSDRALQAHSPDGETIAVPIEKDGGFSLPATTGEWRLELTAHGSVSATRKVAVQQYPVVASQLPAVAIPHARSRPSARTIGFDDLTTSDTLYEVPNGYAGLNWRNWVATHQKLYGGDGYVNATVSSEYVAYTSSGHPATISSPTEFDFVGAYVTAAWPKGEDYDVIVRAWRQDHQVYEDRFRVTVAGPVYFDADYRNISKVEFASDGYWQVAVDDVTVRTD